MSDNILSRLANTLPIRWGYFTKNKQAQKVIFIGHEKAIYGADGVQLDSKLTSIKNSISDAFSEGKAYVAGEYCIYLNRLYRFTSPKPAGPWDGTKVVPASVSNDLASLNSNKAAIFTISTGGDKTKSFNFMANIIRTPVIIVIGSQLENDTDILAATFFGDGHVSGPSKLPEGFAIYGENNVCTIEYNKISKWGYIMILYQAVHISFW